MVMLTWFSSPIFAWNFLTPSLVTPDGGKHANHHHKITVFYKCNVKTVLYCLQYLKKAEKIFHFHTEIFKSLTDCSGCLTIAHHHTCHLLSDALASVTGLC